MTSRVGGTPAAGKVVQTSKVTQVAESGAVEAGTEPRATAELATSEGKAPQTVAAQRILQRSTGLHIKDVAGSPPMDALGLSRPEAQRLGWIVPSDHTVRSAAASLVKALSGIEAKGGNDTYVALDRNAVWSRKPVQDLVKAAFQGEIHLEDPRLDARVSEVLHHMVTSVPGTELPFIRPGNRTIPYHRGQEMLLPAHVPPPLAQEAQEGEAKVAGEPIEGIDPADQLSEGMTLFHEDALPKEGAAGKFEGTFVAADYLGNMNVSLPRWVDPTKADATKLVENLPVRFDWAVGTEPNSISSDEFFQKLWDATPKSRKEQINWIIHEAYEKAPELVALLPKGATKEDVKRSLLMAFHHVKDIQYSMAAFGYPEWMVGHDWMEIVTTQTLRDRAVWKSDRAVVEWIDRVPKEAFPNAGIANPVNLMAYALWSMGLREHPGQSSMQIHRAVPHHTGAPDAKAEIVERGINGQMHHAHAQGPYGVRGEQAVPFSQWTEDLEEVFVHDSAFKSTVLHPLGRDSLAMTSRLMQEGKVTPLHLMKVEPVKWESLEVHMEKRAELPWAKSLRHELVRKNASQTWWDLPEGDRVPLIQLGANEIYWLAEYGPDQKVTGQLETTQPVATLREAKEKLGNRKEVQDVGTALWVTYTELAISNPDSRARYQGLMREVAEILGTTSAALVEKIATDETRAALQAAIG